MAYAFSTTLQKASISRSIKKGAKPCQECGQEPVPLEVDLPDYMGKRFGMGCPDGHGRILAEAVQTWVDGDMAAYYRAMLDSINPMIDAWNDQQEEKRLAKAFPGAKA